MDWMVPLVDKKKIYTTKSSLRVINRVKTAAIKPEINPKDKVFFKPNLSEDLPITTFIIHNPAIKEAFTAEA